MSNNKLAVYIGRFQPFHSGHKYVVDKALTKSRGVLILVGSANTSRSIKNPFSYEERARMIEMAYGNCPWTPNIEALDDYTYEPNQWITDVQSIIEQYEPKSNNVILVGHTKDDSSYYLKCFPQYESMEVDYFETIDATQIRDLYYQKKFKFIEGAVPTGIYKSLLDFSKTECYNSIIEEWNYINNYKQMFSGFIYPPTFQTVDAVVVQSGHILLIKRGELPGRGLWALPGGFVNQKETLEQACIRELKEETKLKVPIPVLLGSIKKIQTFDDPNRSSRGRTITQAYLIKLDDTQELPKVKGSDDAKEAKWVPLSEFYDMATSIYEDHYHIIRKLIDNI